VTITPNSAGTWSATISIANNDSDENPYNWTVSGTTANGYTVTFNKQSGTGGSASVVATVGYAMPTATAPTRAGYTFGGYYTATNGAGTQYYTETMASAQNWDLSADTTLYAKWTVNSYTVTFDKQGGAGGNDTVVATYDASMPTATAPTRTGYTFGGYYSATNGAGTQYYTGAMAGVGTWNVAVDTTLYAKWTANSYTVTFNANGGGTPSPTNKVVSYDSAFGTLATVSRTGYNFNGWFTAASGGSQVTSGSLNTVPANQTLYAQWTAITYVVSYDPNGATSGVEPSDQTKTYDVPLTLAINSGNLARTGYNFMGWNTATNGAGVDYDEGVSYTNNAAIVLYAKWTPITYVVSYNANSATSGTAPGNQSKVYDVNLTLALNSGSLTRTGYTFAGWNTAANGSGTDYAVGATYTVNAALTLYAKWTPDTYVVSYNANSATSGTAPANQTKTNGVNLTLATNSGSLARTGYTFAGWNTAANGSGTDYAVGATYTGNTALTLYAKWTPNTYVVSYSANGATSGTAPANQTKTNDVNLTLATNSGNLARTGYVFVGWNTATNGAGTDYAVGATYTGNTALALYAKWTSVLAPTSLNATALSSTQIKLTWVDNSADETGFLVERSNTSGSGFASIGTAGVNATNYTDSTVSAGLTYYYRVSATNAITSSAPSAEASATTPKLPATVTLGNLSQTYDGTARSVSVTTSPTGLTVNVTYNGNASAPVNAGSYAVTGTVVSATYQGATNGTLVVAKATPSVSAWPTASSIIIGQAVSNATLNGGSASVPGSFAYVSPTNIPPAGTYSASVTFTPTDSVNYSSVSGSAQITVVNVYAVPFLEPFEARQLGDLNGQFGWLSEGTVVQSTNTFGGSAKAAQISGDGGSLRHTFSDSRTKVWTDMRLKVVQSPEKPKPDTNATAAVYISTNAVVMAFNGTNVVSTGALANQGEWVRFTFFSDYAAKTYILFVNDVRVGKYGFYNAGVPVFTELKVGGQSTFVDNVGVTPSQPAMKGMPSLILLQ
jgi:uncharacterized repeat protein (TIGR02543 family)